MAALPDWMQKIKNDEDAELQRQQERTRATALMDALMNTEAKSMWRNVIRAVGDLAEHSKEVGVIVQPSEINNSPEPLLRVIATGSGRSSLWQLHTHHTDLIFAPRQYVIKRVDMLSDKIYHYQFCLSGESLALCSGGRYITPEGIADEVVRFLIETLRHQR